MKNLLIQKYYLFLYTGYGILVKNVKIVEKKIRLIESSGLKSLYNPPVAYEKFIDSKVLFVFVCWLRQFGKKC
jgi:hypothetical protein